jgi:hypothetical protein
VNTWRSLHAIGTSKVVNTSFIWLALIPFLARVLDALHAGERLPFNFVAFYFAAFFFTLASLIFNMACPVVIKLSPTFGAFKSGGYSLLELKNWYHDMATARDGTSRDTNLVRQFLSNLGAPDNVSATEYPDLMSGAAGSSLLSRFWSYPAVSDDHLAQVHNLTIGEAEKKNIGWRKGAAILYVIGFILFGLVALLNLCVVAKVSWQVIKASWQAIFLGS